MTKTATPAEVEQLLQPKRGRGRPRTKEVVIPDYTPSDVYKPYLLRVMSSMRKPHVFSEIQERTKNLIESEGAFKDADYTKMQNNIERWKAQMAAARYSLEKTGMISKNENKEWCLTEEGKKNSKNSLS